MTTVDESSLQALDRANLSSDATTANFVDAITGVTYGKVKRTSGIGRPSFSASELIPPGSPDAFQVEAMKQLVVGAATRFVSEFMPEEVAVQSAYATARERLAEMAAGDNLALPGAGTPGGYLHGIGQFFKSGGDTYPDYICAPLAAELDAFVATTYTSGESIAQADIARDLYVFALSSPVWRDRGAALRAVTDYVATVADMDNLAADTQVRIEQASAAMQAAMSKWIAAQIEGNLDSTVDIALAKKATGEEIDKNSHEYSAVKARVNTAREGAVELSHVVRAARSAINTVVSQSKYLNE